MSTPATGDTLFRHALFRHDKDRSLNEVPDKGGKKIEQKM